LNNLVATTPSVTRTVADDLLTRFNTYFQSTPAVSPRLIETAFALRYQVYCLERNFEEAARFDNCLEQDEFDSRALHSLVFHRPSAQAIGTVRLIPAGYVRDSMPIQKILRANDIDASRYFSAAETAEISRFAISKDFRRRNADRAKTGTDCASEIERRSNLPCLGLIQGILRHSLDMGISTWAAVMEPQLIRMLACMGIRFTPIGPVVSHHGLRQPAFCDVPRMLKNLEIEKPDFWSVVTNAGELFYPTRSFIPQRCVA
jgi:N-acyl amino acid synthase of PEP-CTERM/exosortase system